MISVLGYGPNEEMMCVRDMLAEIGMRESWKECTFRHMKTEKELLNFQEHSQILVCSLLNARTVELLKQAHRQSPETLIVPIADASIPPMSYVHPDIMPSGLLWRPLQKGANHAVLERVLSECEDTAQELFVVKKKGEAIQVPMRRIYYFEAHSKKILLRLDRKEIPFYDTLSQLEMKLPAFFIRCHKGYLVNQNLISRVDWSSHTLQMENGSVIPISKTYWSAVKELLYGR